VQTREKNQRVQSAEGAPNSRTRTLLSLQVRLPKPTPNAHRHTDGRPDQCGLGSFRGELSSGGTAKAGGICLDRLPIGRPLSPAIAAITTTSHTHLFEVRSGQSWALVTTGPSLGSTCPRTACGTKVPKTRSGVASEGCVSCEQRDAVHR
jgi:hypothetical protein